MNRDPVLVLGAGINGAAIARELVLNDVPVCVVDIGDIAGGTTAYSSRLIHGGLRYLEYGELGLVRESLRERERLLHLAPHFVQPLRLVIPVQRRMSGLVQSGARLLGLERWLGGYPKPRGLWLVLTGLWLYDRFARSSVLPGHEVFSVGTSGLPPVNRERYRWLCCYWDAQVKYPERLVLAMLTDAQREADRRGIQCEVMNYSRAELDGDRVVVTHDREPAPPAPWRPAAIINATGAWVDQTLNRLHVPAPRLIGGTKGSHLFVYHPRLREALGNDGVYAEADDGRPVFLLPFYDLCLIGTTDLPYNGPPEDAVASAEEIDYLLAAVHRVFPQVSLSAADVLFHYSGVRPLPHTDARNPGAITRRHKLVFHGDAAVPMWSVVGGKLTTCRSLAEQVVAELGAHLGMKVRESSRNRLFPGAEDYPLQPEQLHDRISQLAVRASIPQESAEVLWRLFGTSAQSILDVALADAKARQEVHGTGIPQGVVRWVISHEWVRRLADLVERRLMVLYDRRLSRASLLSLARIMADAGTITPLQVESEVAEYERRLADHFGRRLDAGKQPSSTHVC